MVVATRTPYKKPFPIPFNKIAASVRPIALNEIIVLINIRIVTAMNSAMHPRTVLKKLFGVQKRSLLLYVVVMNWRDSNGVLSYTEAESNIVLFPQSHLPRLSLPGVLYCGIWLELGITPRNVIPVNVSF